MLENKFIWFIFPNYSLVSATCNPNEESKNGREYVIHTLHNHTAQQHQTPHQPPRPGYSLWTFILLLPTIRRCFRKFLERRAFVKVEETQRWESRKKGNTNRHGEETEAEERLKMSHSDVTHDKCRRTSVWSYATASNLLSSLATCSDFLKAALQKYPCPDN